MYTTSELVDVLSLGLGSTLNDLRDPDSTMWNIARYMVFDMPGDLCLSTKQEDEESTWEARNNRLNSLLTQKVHLQRRINHFTRMHLCTKSSVCNARGPTT